ncbi:MAG TPA: hypothetical protein VNY83_07775 [Solirubrobacterales bacterium]|jgi:hypothetical protein|nr:hypothetical protein [Solirubrobacterales bacterium]
MGCGGVIVLLIGIGLVASTGTVGIVAAVVMLGAMWIAAERIKAKEREGK